MILVFEDFISLFSNFNNLIYILFYLFNIFLDQQGLSTSQLNRLFKINYFFIDLILTIFLTFKVISILLDLFKKMIIIFITVMNKLLLKLFLLFKVLSISLENKFLLFQKAKLSLIHILLFLYCGLDFIRFDNVILDSSHIFFATKYFCLLLL